MESILKRTLAGGVALFTMMTMAAMGPPHPVRASLLAPTPVRTLPPGPTPRPTPLGTLPPGPTYHQTVTIYQVSQGPVSAARQPVLGARVYFRFCFTQELSRPRTTLVIYRGRDVPGAPVLYRRTMHRGAVSGAHYCFESTLGIDKKKAVGRDTAAFTIWSGSKPIIVFHRMFSVHQASGKG